MASISADDLLRAFRSGLQVPGESCSVFGHQAHEGSPAELTLSTVMQFLRDATSMPGPFPALAAVEFVHRLVATHGFRLQLPAPATGGHGETTPETSRPSPPAPCRAAALHRTGSYPD